MFQRILSPSRKNSYFLFGARGTGKTTLLHQLYPEAETLYIDLLDPETEDRFSRHPQELEAQVAALDGQQTRIIIDEVQKVPKLLDLVQRLIEATTHQFILTGSSGRKLKRGASNLLAGRAFVYHLFPLTAAEIGGQFDLMDALCWGTLPGIFQYSDPQDKAAFLRAYALTYLKEEIQSEQLIRNLDPFRQFLEVSAQCSGSIINYTRIAGDVGVDTKTVQNYFSILEDTLIGIVLQPYHRSVRKRQRSNPKFYLFDSGVKRALDRTLSLGLREATYEFGNLFEHFIINEIIRSSRYRFPDWRVFYLRTRDGAEIDLIIDRPGMATALIEIKSSMEITGRDTAALHHFAPDFRHAELFCLSRDPHEKRMGTVHCLHWRAGLERLFQSG